MPPDDAVVRRTIDREQPVSDVARVLAELEETDPMDLDTLYDAVGDLVERLFAEAAPEANATLGFTIEGWRVTVHRDGIATFAQVD